MDKPLNSTPAAKPAAADSAAPPPAKPEEKAQVLTPVLNGFSIPARRIGEVEDILDALSTLSFLKAVSDGNRIAVLNVESRDIKRSPYLFSTVYLASDSLDVVYSTVPGVSLRKRAIEIYRHLLNILTVLDGVYAVEQKALYQNMQSALQGLTEFASAEYNDVFAKYDFLEHDFAALKVRAEAVELANAKISHELIEVRAQNDDLTVRLNQLEAYSDQTLMAKIQDWLDVHRNEINVGEFSKQFGVPESRVESVLNAMVVQGYLELRS